MSELCRELYGRSLHCWKHDDSALSFFKTTWLSLWPKLIWIVSDSLITVLCFFITSFYFLFSQGKIIAELLSLTFSHSITCTLKCVLCVCVCAYAPPCISISRSKALPAVNLHTGWLFPQVELYDLLKISLSTTMALFWIQTSLLSSALQMIQSQTLACALKSCDPVNKLGLMFWLCCYAVGKLFLTVVLHDKVHFLTMWAGCKINTCQNPKVRKMDLERKTVTHQVAGTGT